MDPCLEQLTNDPAFDDQAALSPDGRTLAFISTRTGHAELWTLDLATRKLRNITNHAGGHFRPAWSPDGQWLAISSDRDSPNPHRPDGFELIQQTDIYVLHPDGSGLRRLTHTNSFAGSPSWSPDGKQIAFYKASFNDVIRISDPRHLRGVTPDRRGRCRHRSRTRSGPAARARSGRRSGSPTVASAMLPADPKVALSSSPPSPTIPPAPPALAANSTARTGLPTEGV